MVSDLCFVQCPVKTWFFSLWHCACSGNLLKLSTTRNYKDYVEVFLYARNSTLMCLYSDKRFLQQDVKASMSWQGSTINSNRTSNARRPKLPLSLCIHWANPKSLCYVSVSGLTIPSCLGWRDASEYYVTLYWRHPKSVPIIMLQLCWIGSRQNCC